MPLRGGDEFFFFWNTREYLDNYARAMIQTKYSSKFGRKGRTGIILSVSKDTKL